MSSSIEVMMTGDEAKLFRAFQKLMTGQKQLEDGFEKVKKKADGAAEGVEKLGKKGEQSFGAKALTELDKFAQGFVNVGTVINVVSGAVEKLKNDTASAVQSVQQLKAERKEMAQLAEGSADYAKMVQTSQRVASKYGLSQEESTKLTNAAKAGGFESTLDQVALATATFAPADDLIPTAASLPTVFEGLTTEQALNLTAAGGTQAKNMTFAGVAKELRGAAQGAGPAGSSAVETTALVTVLSDLFGQSTGDRIRAFGSKVAMDPELRGKGIMQSFEMMQKDPALRKGFLGDSQELHAVYNKLAAGAAPQVRAMEGTLAESMRASGTPNSPLMLGARSFLEDPMNRAAFNADVAARQAEIAQMNKLAPEGLQIQADMDRQRKRMLENGTNPISRFLAESMMQTDAFILDPILGKSPWRTQSAPGTDTKNDAASQAINGLGEAAKKLDAAATNLQSQTQSRSNAQRNEAAMGGGER